MFAARAGAINLAAQLEREKTAKMIELVLSCLNSFITSENFDAKLQYILEMGGIDQLSRWLVQKPPFDKNPKYGEKGLNKNLARSIRLKLFQLLNDLVLND